MDSYCAGFQEPVCDVNSIATAVEPRAAGITDRFPALDSQWVVGLEVFARNVHEGGPEGMTVWTVTDWPTRDASEADRVELEPLALAFTLDVVAGVHEVRRG